ncbi:MAG: long-chain fatty acid--CoA ligase [Actinobacteria bacterium]|nr:long-chain fatty acid--CoA ligase [Actinomycetota bacterium]
MSLAELLAEHPFGDDEELLHSIDRSLTAGAARAEAADVAARLREAGIEPGQPVAVALGDAIDTVVAMFGVWIAGGVLVPLNPRAPSRERVGLLDAIAPAAVLDDTGLHRQEGARALPDDSAFVLWTSGTTGRPKPVLHTHAAYVELLDRVLGSLASRAERREMPNIVPVSLALNAGIYNVLFALRSGAGVVVMDRFDPQTFATLVRRFAIRSAVLPPAAMTMLCDDERVDDLSPLRYVRSITAPLSPVQARRFAGAFGVTVLNGYGQAEIGEVIGWTGADAREHPDKIGAVGRPHSNVDVRIVRDDGRVADDGEVGELHVRLPKMAAGYADGSSIDDRIDADGFLRTGDLARVDPDGFVWIEGRVGDVINRGGNKVFPGHVEEVLRLSPRVDDAAVVGVPDDRLGEIPVAFVVGDASDDELVALCRDHLVAYKVPAAFHRVDSLPRNEVGKVMRSALVARAGVP